MEDPSVILETPRLILRKFRDSDTEAILAFRGDPRVMRFSLRGPEPRDDIRTRYLPSVLKRYSRDGVGQWAVVRKEDGVLIGECGICLQEVDDGRREFEIGYRLRRDCWGLGLATEAASGCRDYGFGTLRLNRLVSLIEAENAASIRVAERVGMIFEREASFHDIPVLIYGISRTDG